MFPAGTAQSVIARLVPVNLCLKAHSKDFPGPELVKESKPVPLRRGMGHPGRSLGMCAGVTA